MSALINLHRQRLSQDMHSAGIFKAIRLMKRINGLLLSNSCERISIFTLRFVRWTWILILTLITSDTVVAQDFVDPASEVRLGDKQPATFDPSSSLEGRMEALEQQNATLFQQQASLLEQVEQLNQQNRSLRNRTSMFPGYDRQLGAFTLIRGTPASPYELRADAWAEARFLYFSPNRDTWTDSTGTTRPIDGLDSIEITRNFINLAGHALDPRLQYSAFIFSSTALNETVYMGWVNYQFCEEFDLRAGNWLVPGTREWLDSVRYTLGVERLMATTFFRPAVSPGVWAQGKLWEQWNYRLMVANSVNRWSQGIERVGSAKAVAMTAFWEPTNDFGPGPSDMEFHEIPSFRLGASSVLSKESNQSFDEAPGANNPDDVILRLSDGTPLFRPGSLGPNVQLQSARVSLWAIDAAVKYRGWSLSGEYMFRLLNDFESGQISPTLSSVFDHGGLLQSGTLLVKKRVEAFVRTSFVNGPFGDGYEYGGGLNWFPQGTRDCRLTAELLQINDSPAQNLLTGYRAGGSGTLLQLQWFFDL